MLFRSLSAVSQSFASKPMVAVEVFVPLDLVRAMAIAAQNKRGTWTVES